MQKLKQFLSEWLENADMWDIFGSLLGLFFIFGVLLPVCIMLWKLAFHTLN